MNENKGELMITVPYEDFLTGVQALQTIIAIRRILKDKEGFASGDIESILGLAVEKKAPINTMKEAMKETMEEQGNIKE